jgi:DNA protecting protein DprA
MSSDLAWVVWIHTQTFTGWELLDPLVHYWRHHGWPGLEQVCKRPEYFLPVLVDDWPVWIEMSLERQQSWQSRMIKLLHWCRANIVGKSQLECQSTISAKFEGKLLYLVTYWDTAYPSELRQIADPPPVLWANHPWEKWQWPERRIAVIGSRRMSVYGQQVTETLVQHLVKQFGVGIVSGCAQGVDGQAQLTCVQFAGTTVGVLGCGLSRITATLPKRLMKDKRALIISEFAPTLSAQPYMFLKRNRLISALSAGVVIVEAQDRSGTLNTASHALEQGKEVMVIPQSLWNQNASGIIRLANQGATLVQNAEEIMSMLDWQWQGLNGQKADTTFTANTVERKMLQLLKEYQGQMSVADVLFHRPKEVPLTLWQKSFQRLEQKNVLRRVYGVVQIAHSLV